MEILFGKTKRTYGNRRKSFSSNVPKVGLEPTRPEGHWILNPARLPIPPLRLIACFFYRPYFLPQPTR